MKGQDEGCCLLGRDTVATAAGHLIATFIFILLLAVSGWICPLHPTSNNQRGSGSSNTLAPVWQRVSPPAL